MKYFYQICYYCNKTTKFSVNSGAYGKFYKCAECGKKINIFRNPNYIPPKKPESEDEDIMIL